MPYGFNKIRFRNGYAKNARELTIEWLGIEVKQPNSDWCPPEDVSKLLFSLKLGEIISSNCE
jgi:hypothetical protein